MGVMKCNHSDNIAHRMRNGRCREKQNSNKKRVAYNNENTDTDADNRFSLCPPTAKQIGQDEKRRLSLVDAALGA